MYYELGYMSLCRNQSTYLNMNYELVYFELITGKKCQYESKRFISRIKENQPILAQTCLY